MPKFVFISVHKRHNYCKNMSLKNKKTVNLYSPYCLRFVYPFRNYWRYIRYIRIDAKIFVYCMFYKILNRSSNIHRCFKNRMGLKRETLVQTKIGGNLMDHFCHIVLQNPLMYINRLFLIVHAECILEISLSKKKLTFQTRDKRTHRQ